MVHTVPVRSRPPSLIALLRAAPVVVAPVLVVVSVLSACSSSDGRTLPLADPHKTTTSVSAPVVGQPSEEPGATGAFSLTSPAFVDGAEIPARHLCTGENLSPTLLWSSTPPAAELALVVRDRDAAGFVHWVVTGIDPVVQGIGEGGVPEGAVEAANSTGTVGWAGPCPPAGTGTHTYAFVLHALPEPLTISPGLAANEAAQLVEGSSSARATLSGTATAPG